MNGNFSEKAGFYGPFFTKDDAGTGCCTTGQVLSVGAAGSFRTPQEAYHAAQPGDIIEIDAGTTYFGEAAKLHITGKDNITFKGVNGRARMIVEASTPLVGAKGIWLLNASNITIENIEFSGATLDVDKNGAGIRLDPDAGGALVIRNCYFHHNDNGILGGYNKTLDFLIEHSEFCYNGYGDGYSHNMYIGMAKSFTLRYSYSHHVKMGHLVKSRAIDNYILYNRITHEDTAEDFMRYNSNLDLPQGGTAYVIGNAFHQGPKGQRFMLSFAKENQKNQGKTCYIASNTFVNYGTDGSFLHCPVGGYEMKAVNNIFSGTAPLTVGEAEWSLSNNLCNTDDTVFADAAAFDLRLGDTASKAGNVAAADPGEGKGFSLKPVKQYVHKCSFNDRSEAAKVGAFE